MTEYWKSQARKYCDFCKCWLADNKVSISFHENGKRHKENVQKHISTLSKKSAKDHKQKEKMDDEIKKMEEAAMAAYLKDVENNADLTSQNINAMLGNSTAPVTTGLASAPLPSVSTEKPPTPLWHEVQSDNGTYFWNTETNETTWDPPDSYLSLAEQQAIELREQKEKTKKEDIKREKHKESVKEVKAHLKRERMKERAVKPEVEPAPATPLVDYGPAPRANLLGAWTPVVEEPVQQIDLQLPATQKFVPPVVMEPERITFKEKKVESLGEGPVEFKKRKFNNPKKNMRQKFDHD